MLYALFLLRTDYHIAAHLDPTSQRSLVIIALKMVLFNDRVLFNPLFSNLAIS